jgi:hypothetical protein
VNSSNGGVRVYTSVMSDAPDDPTRGQVTARADGRGNFTFTVNAQPGFDGYTFTVGLANAGALTSVQGTSCGNCWRTGSFSTDTLVGRFLYLDPTAAGFSYLSIGHWAVNPTANGEAQSTGAGVVGIPTRTADIPKTGTATYTGQFIGTYRNGTQSGPIGAIASATANFGSGVVALQTTNSFGQFFNGNDMATPFLDFAGTMTGMSTNQLRGTMATRDGMIGDAHGAFFGPAAQELGGAVVFKRPPTVTNNLSFQGAFGLKKQ